MAKIHKDPESGMTVGQLENDESEWRKANPDGFGNTVEAVRLDAEYIAQQTGADADTVQNALMKRFKPHADDADSITRRDEELSDEDLAALFD